MLINGQRSTRRRDTPPPIRTALAGLGVVLLLVILGWQALRVYNGVPGRDYSTLFVSTPEVGNLLNHDQVRIAGARVGQVVGRDLGSDGKPRLKLQIEPGTDLPADTRVAVRGAGLLGARYIELIPGDGEEPLAEGATIRGDDSSFTYGLPEALDTFDRETRGALGSMIGGLGEGLLGHGVELNDAIHAAGTRSRPFGEFAATVLRRNGAAGRLVPALEAAVRPLDANRSELSDLFRATGDALTPFVDRRAEMREALDEAPPALAAIPPGLTAGSRLLASLRAASYQATETLGPAPEALDDLTALLRESRQPLARGRRLLAAAEDAVPGALRVTSAVQPLLRPATDLMGDLSPVLGTLGSYGCNIVNWAAVMRSMTGYQQPGRGPHGPAQAFRLQMVLPLSVDAVGVKDPTGFAEREGVVTPCTYLAKPYPQTPGGSE